MEEKLYKELMLKTCQIWIGKQAPRYMKWKNEPAYRYIKIKLSFYVNRF